MANPVATLVVGIVLTIISFIVGFQVVGNTSADLTTAADNISNSGLPLATLFQSSGVLMLVFMAFLFLGFLGIAFGMAKMGK